MTDKDAHRSDRGRPEPAGPADLTKSLRDAAYTAVGFGVLGLQRAQVRRRELADQLQSQRPELEAQLDQARDQLADLARDLERRIEPALVDVSQRVEPVLEHIEARLPEQARAPLAQIRLAARETQDQLRARRDRQEGTEDL